MRFTVHAFSALAAACLMSATAQSMPVTAGGMAPAAAILDPIEQTAVYIVSGRRYCFYPRGWHGPGWYRCGFAWKRGLGWGGVYGWQGWTYGPAARRYGGGSVTIRDRDRRSYEGRTFRGESGVRGEVRSGDSGRRLRRDDGVTTRGDTTGQSSSDPRRQLAPAQQSPSTDVQRGGRSGDGSGNRERGRGGDGPGNRGGERGGDGPGNRGSR